jgi:peptidoglycan hydrolase FlgJ
MSALSAVAGFAAKLDTVAAVAQTVVQSVEEKTKRAQIAETAKNFEASFMSVMMQQMFEGVKTSEPFGGGNGEAMFKSMMSDAMSKQVSKAGGIGLASSIQREMLKMQGLKE